MVEEKQPTALQIWYDLCSEAGYKGSVAKIFDMVYDKKVRSEIDEKLIDMWMDGEVVWEESL